MNNAQETLHYNLEQLKVHVFSLSTQDEQFQRGTPRLGTRYGVDIWHLWRWKLYSTTIVCSKCAVVLLEHV